MHSAVCTRSAGCARLQRCQSRFDRVQTRNDRWRRGDGDGIHLSRGILCLTRSAMPDQADDQSDQNSEADAGQLECKRAQECAYDD